MVESPCQAQGKGKSNQGPNSTSPKDQASGSSKVEGLGHQSKKELEGKLEKAETANVLIEMRSAEQWALDPAMMQLWDDL